MKTLHVCGKRGLGDIVAGISYILKNYQDIHIIYHYPPGYDYKTTIDLLMVEYNAKSLNITYEIDESWYTVHKNVAAKKFGLENFTKTWIETPGARQRTPYLPFTTQWKGNTKGPICLTLNNENCNPTYPYPGKWFDYKTNDYLENLIDDKNYLWLGKPFSIAENIRRMSECRYIVGVDGAWAHIANSMRVPFIMVRNNLEKHIINETHPCHPTLNVIETSQVLNYLTL